MKQRPLVLTALLLTAALALLQLLGITPEIPKQGDAQAAILLEEKHSFRFIGQVRFSEQKKRSAAVLLKDCVLYEKDRPLSISGVRLIVSKEDRYPAGCILEMKGELREIRGVENPGQFDSALYDRLRGLRYECRDPEILVLKEGHRPLTEGLSFLRERCKARIGQIFPEDVSGILSAVLLGDRTSLSEETRSLWQTGGIMHLLSISGLHLTLMGMGLYRLLRRCRLCMKPAGLLSIGLMTAYTVFTGAAVSTLRALLMFVLVIIADLIGRTYDPLSALALSAVLLLLESPLYLRYSGFQLSFCAVLSVHLLKKRSRPMQALGLTLCMLPLILWHYFKLPLYSLAVNALLIPMLPLILAAGLAGTVFGFLCPLTARACVLLLRAVALLLEAVRTLPGSSLITGRPEPLMLPLYYLLLFLFLKGTWAFRYRARRFLFFALLPLLLLISALHLRTDLVLIFQSAGQGDSILIETPDYRNVLIDGGSSSVSRVGRYRLLPCIESEGISVLDYLFVTHMDADHVNGITEILEEIRARRTPLRVRTLVLPYLKTPASDMRELTELALELGIRVLFVSKGDRLALGELQLHILNPDPAAETSPPDTNGQCIVLALHYRDFDALLTGDVSGSGEEELTASLQKEGRSYECLKVAHHGSRYSTPMELLSAIRPYLSVISCGRDNSYGHPHDVLLKRLRDAGTETVRTDLDGAVILRTDGRICRLRTLLGGRKDAFFCSS